MNKVKVGVAGLGQGSNHLRIFKNYIEETEVVALCDVLEDRALKVASDEEVPQVYTDYDEMLGESGIDVVVIATPGGLHGPQSLAALNAGVHVLVEVPIVERSSQLDLCGELVKTVERTGLKLQMGNHMRWDPKDRMMRDMVADEKLGEIFYGESEYLHNLLYLFVKDGIRQWRDGFGQVTQETITSGGGIHAVDTLRWIMGDEFTEVFGYGNRKCTPYRDVNDMEVAIFKTASGAVAKIACSKALVRPGCFHYRSIYGTKGSLERGRQEDYLSGFFGEVDSQIGTDNPYVTMKTIPVERTGLEEEIVKKTGHGGHTFFQNRDFVDAILKDREPEINVVESTRSCAAAICALKSINEGRIIKIPQFYDRLREGHVTIIP